MGSTCASVLIVLLVGFEPLTLWVGTKRKRPRRCSRESTTWTFHYRAHFILSIYLNWINKMFNFFEISLNLCPVTLKLERLASLKISSMLVFFIFFFEQKKVWPLSIVIENKNSHSPVLTKLRRRFLEIYFFQLINIDFSACVF